MTLSEFLTLSTYAAFSLLTFLTVVDYLRYRGSARLDIMLMFGGLSIIFITRLLERLFPQVNWSDTPGWLGLLAHPYLYLRLTQHFRVIHKSVVWAALVGMFLSWLIAIFYLADAPIYMVIFAIGYFVGIEGYAIYVCTQETQRTGGVTRYRLNLVAGGSGTVAVIMVMVGFASIYPVWMPTVNLVGSLLFILVGVSYYLGFSPPRPLRHAWQLNELNNFLREAATHPGTGKDSAISQRLCHSSIRAVGGIASLVLLQDEHGGKMRMAASEGFPNLPQLIYGNEGTAGQAWLDRKAFAVQNTNLLGDEEKRLAASVSSETLLAVPIKAHERIWGVLLVFLLRSPLFAEDDLSLLTLFAEQSAYALENLQLLQEVHRHAAELEQRVIERTTELQNALDSLQRRNRDLALLHRASQMVTATLDLQQVIEQLLRVAAEIVSAEAGSVWLWESGETAWLNCRAFINQSQIQTPAGLRLSSGEGVAGWVAKHGTPVLVNDVENDPRFLPQISAAIGVTTKNMLAVPLQVGDVMSGVLIVSNKQHSVFDENDLFLTQTLASTAAIAIENAHLFTEVQRLSVTDELTGLFSRRHFFTIAGQEFQRASRYGHDFAIIMLDIDHFKLINDKHGHLVGDKALKRLANDLNRTIRRMDFVSRYGGEEFVILLPETNLETAERTAERLREYIESHPFETDQGKFTLTISAGVAGFSTDSTDIESILAQADKALYQAKIAGRNKVVCAR